jgi:regulator of sirC expression with transglutaminase-like and TPR domain
MSSQERSMITQLAKKFPNRNLKGYSVGNEKELLALDSNEIDLAHALMIAQPSPNANDEALLDLMALQILARLPKNPSAEDKINAINHFIFYELAFKFPPESLYAEAIDLYTFLPYVLQSRQGVCLGVSTLYLCLAQRLELNLKIITPPGHIFLSYQDKETTINIETTARGIHLPTKTYLSINTRKLPERSIKEVIGLHFFNQASTFWHKKKYKQAITAYKKAQLYLEDDPLLTELLGYQYLAIGEKEEAFRYLKTVVNSLPDHLVSKSSLADDLLKGNGDLSAVQATFLQVDHTRASILEKQLALKKVCERFPNFREGLLHLSITWLQLHRSEEAIGALQRYHALDDSNPIVEYYLSSLYFERWNYPLAWKHLKQAEKLLAQRDHYPEALKELRYALTIKAHPGMR